MPTIRIYLCPEKDNGLELEAEEAYTRRTSLTSLTKSGESIALPMIPAGGVTVARQLALKIMPHGHDLLCRHAGRIILRRAALAPGGRESDKRQEDPYYEVDELILNHLEARVSHPDHCQWERTYLAVSPEGASPPRALSYAVYAADTLPSAINARPKAPADTIFPISRLEIAPGELAFSMWRTIDSTSVWDSPSASQWFRTCCLTGGAVTAVHGVPGGSVVTYTVRCQGVDVPCRATDHTAYSIGEWVTVLDTGSGCRACGRTVRCPAEVGEAAPPSSGIIVPIKILNHNVAGAFGEYALEFDSGDLSRLLRMCMETAQVLAVDEDADRMDIHIDGADRVGSVPVHYRCAPEGSAKGGAGVFLPDDLVLVLRIAHTSERIVVGFAEEVRPCDIRRSTVLCFLVEKVSCLYEDISLMTGSLDENYGWEPSSWSTHISRGNWLADDPALDMYYSEYCTPTYESCYEKVYIRVWDDGSVEEVADPASENLETKDCYSATRWRKLIAQRSYDGCPSLPTYSDHIAVGHELIAPTYQENVILPDGSRLALAKSMAGFSAVLIPAVSQEDPSPEPLTAYAVHDPHDLGQECLKLTDAYTETRETCRYVLPDWYSAITDQILAAGCKCGEPGPCSRALDDLTGANTGDKVAVYHCPWFPPHQYGWEETYPQWHLYFGPCDQLSYGSPRIREMCECHDVTVGADICDCLTLGVKTIHHPPTYQLRDFREPGEMRDIISDEEEIAPDDPEPLGITKPLPGSFHLGVGQTENGDIALSAAGGWEIFNDSRSQFSDEFMEEAALGCEMQYHPRNPEKPDDAPELTLTTTPSGTTTPEWTERDEMELTSRVVDRLRNLVVETTYRKPSESEVQYGALPVAALARGRVWVPELEHEAVRLDVNGILKIIRSHAGSQGNDCAVLRPWCCLPKPKPKPLQP